MAVYCVNEDTNPSSEYLLHTLQKVYETIKICVNMIELPLKTSSVILMPVFMVWNSYNPQWNQNLWRSPTLNGTTSLEMWSNASSHLPRLAGHELSNLHICDVTLPLKISVRGSQCPKLQWMGWRENNLHIDYIEEFYLFSTKVLNCYVMKIPQINLIRYKIYIKMYK